MLLDGKVAIVSGVGPGAGPGQRPGAGPGGRDGRAGGPQRRLPRPGAGARSRRAGGRAIAVPTNLVDPEQVAALVARTVDELRPARRARQQRVPHGHVPAVRGGRPREVAQDLRGQRVGRARPHPGVPPHLEGLRPTQRGDASIVFIISMSMRKIRELEGGYSASKAAVQTAAKTMAVELGPSGVRVNCVAPGWIGGPNVETFIQMDSDARNVVPRRRARRDRGAHPARPHPAPGRHRELGRVLRVAVVAGRHRSDARRQRR